jgi:hypothetical protein
VRISCPLPMRIWFFFQYPNRRLHSEFSYVGSAPGFGVVVGKALCFRCPRDHGPTCQLVDVNDIIK